ncbi:hypothetical protein [uncultured Friedmanniella sp.]|uniref:hypothetical protein n=1 Tax=uncultured Friedmanniella sp. TaxID=335381 RepID=UPI0035CACED8
MTLLLLPLEGHPPWGHGPYADGGMSVLPFLGSFLLVLAVLAALAFSLWRAGRLTLPTLASRQPPEDEARRILAERFARSEISSDEFLERSSLLNWTPGSDAVPARRRRQRRR